MSLPTPTLEAQELTYGMDYQIDVDIQQVLGTAQDVGYGLEAEAQLEVVQRTAETGFIQPLTINPAVITPVVVHGK